MLHARTGRVGDSGRLRHADPQHPAARARRPGAHADEDPDRARSHEVQRRLVGRASADDHGQVEVRNELLQVERLGPGGHVFGRHHGPLDDQDVQLGLQD